MVRRPVISATAWLVTMALGVLLNHTFAWIMLAIAAVLLLHTAAAHERVQHYLPFLGKLPLVTDHAAKRAPQPAPPPLNAEALLKEMVLYKDSAGKGDELLKAAGLYRTPEEREQQVKDAQDELQKTLQAQFAQMGRWGVDTGLQAAQQITRRHTETTRDLHDSGDPQVS